ncbi:hypothetical protein SeMB42_g04120 [Synchytrium endobioticum]|uniref:Mitochondrial import inner membrane translocase subunit TIM50 n=1 Tax=Synchytrium endobioticum TaxID=286115 RepID=A0A507D1B6_9FUNG|nr:hypothetical protein SeLEV6574_g06719 [Synchytrium endobioticum]TPX45068.1 hypothetical protein SeMB42_g04120 [Synchytrium endobioticum]
MAGPRPRILVILDLNGTIIDRVKDRADRKLASANPHCPEPHFTSNAARIYLRPHLEFFLSALFSNFTVAAWTSAQPSNAVPMARGVFGRHFDKLAFVWDRTHCSAVREGRKDHSSIKDLTKVWTHSAWAAGSGATLATAGRAWTPSNTILVDDTPYKASYTPHNILAIPTFSVRDPAVDPKHDTALLAVTAYLLELQRALCAAAHTATVDVRPFLASIPLAVQEPAHIRVWPHTTAAAHLGPPPCAAPAWHMLPYTGLPVAAPSDADYSSYSTPPMYNVYSDNNNYAWAHAAPPPPSPMMGHLLTWPAETNHPALEYPDHWTRWPHIPIVTALPNGHLTPRHGDALPHIEEIDVRNIIDSGSGRESRVLTRSATRGPRAFPYRSDVRRQQHTIVNMTHTRVKRAQIDR